MTNEDILTERIEKTIAVIEEYGIDNFYISYSGGKDSCVVSALVDLAVPGNSIPRVYVDTGIDWQLLRDFVYNNARSDNRIEIIKPSVPIKPMLERDGYPFKSKKHSAFLEIYQRYKTMEGRPGLLHYTHNSSDGVNWSSRFSCPQKLLYQFTPDFKLRVSDKCCKRLKIEPLKKWEKNRNKPFTITGLMSAEGGRRLGAQCIAFRNNNFYAFQPLAPLSKKWEDWFIEMYSIEISELYHDPYNFPRTGCKGCPFAIKLEHELEMMAAFFPNERAQCEYIWKPVYDEYRRIGFRLKEERTHDV